MKLPLWLTMKKHLFLIFLFNGLLSVNLCYSQELVSFNYENGVISSQGPMADGKPEGYWKTYYPDGTLKSEGNRLNYELDSIWKFYSPEGIITQETSYTKGLKNGFRKTYYDTGILSKKEEFLVGVRVGTTQKFYASGKLNETVPLDSLKKGKEQGVGYEYSEVDGRITAVIQYRNGFIAGRERINRKDKFSQKQGLWRFFREDLLVNEEGRFRNDKKNGYWKTFDKEGNLLETLKFEHGILIPDPEELAKLDIKREYHPNAQVKTVGSYSKGVKEGVHREYTVTGEVSASKIYIKGKVIGEGIVDAEGRRQGPWKEFYEQGELKNEGNYKNGLREGGWVFYYRNGKEEQQGAYRKGKPDGDWKWTYRNGQTWRAEVFYDGLEEGNAIEYNDTGKVVTKGNYLSGEREGDWLIDLGDLRMEGGYVAGQRNGVWKYYYSDGKLNFEGKFEQGLEIGKHTGYYNSGQIETYGLYKFGKKEGDWISYEKDGILRRTINYKLDIVVKVDGEKIEQPE